MLSFRVVRSAWRARIDLRAAGDIPGAGHVFLADLTAVSNDRTAAHALTGTEITVAASLAGG